MMIMTRLLQISLLLYLIHVVHSAGGSTGRGKWQVVDPDSNIPCIIMWSQVDFYLSYYQKGTDGVNDGHVQVPSESEVDTAGSSCNVAVMVGSSSVQSQVIQLNFDHMPGWSARFAFTNDKRFQTENGKQWALFQVNVTANYNALPSIFPNPDDPLHQYYTNVDLGNSNDLADTIYAYNQYSFYCPSKQEFAINKNSTIGPLAYVKFSLSWLQAYMSVAPTSTLTPFGTKSICPTDQHETDKVPIIVGGCLAGTIVLTMLVYLLYRSCLPAEVIHLVSVEDSKENLAWEDDEEEMKKEKNGDLHF